ncbi:hypothetical protein, partial [Limosilactobacillus reuteri]|uniref:hypothetical protein n=1 Tax=Limosilactobacillus reuteri TaxID=1598 RepID=UPI001CDB24CA
FVLDCDCVDCVFYVCVAYVGVGVFEYVCLFFQAEDGIRGLRMSRGLGDVYNRQQQRAYKLLTSRYYHSTFAKILPEITYPYN